MKRLHLFVLAGVLAAIALAGFLHKVLVLGFPLKPEERSRLAEMRTKVAAELPELVARDQLRKEASAEATVSGSLRRAIHRSRVPLGEIASQARITPVVLDEFLTGERTLRSDVIDRLAIIVGLELKESVA